MDFVCPTCGRAIPRNLEVIVPHTEEHIIDVIKKKHPEWVSTNGICKKCYEYYKKQFHRDG